MAEVLQKLEPENAIPILTESPLGGEEYYNYDATLEIRFMISSRHAGGIIGKSGSYINKIRDRAEVDFHVHRSISDNVPSYTDGSVTNSFLRKRRKVKERSHREYLRACQNSPVRTGSCRGRVRNVVQGLLLMADKIHELSKSHVRRPSTNGTIFQYGDYQLTLLLEHKNCGVIIGKRGARINCNRQRSGAHIKISTHTLENSSEKTVDIQGSRQAIENALETLIVQIANDPKPSSTQRKYLDDTVQAKSRNAFFSHGRTSHHQSSMLQFYPHLLPPNSYSPSPASTASYVIPPTHHYPGVAGSQGLEVATHTTPLSSLDGRVMVVSEGENVELHNSRSVGRSPVFSRENRL